MPARLEFDTIFAPASGGGRAAIAIIRISGPQTDAALEALAPGGGLKDRVATLRTFRDPVSNEALDRAMILRFYAPRSFTGEEMAELHLTGGRAILSGVIAALGKVSGLRPAEPGEFAWRAYANGKLDLSEVEGLADLVDAETAAQRRQALRLAGGALSREAEAIRALLLSAISTLEAQIDFSDVEDAESLSLADALEFAQEASERIRSVMATSRVGERVRDGLNVIIAGPPNVGKSTLMNVLARRDVSIVSPIPGTTRDLIEVALDINGFPVKLFDSAGIRETSDPVEREGVDRARRRLQAADLTLWLVEQDGSPLDIPESPGAYLIVETKSDREPGPADGGRCKVQPNLRISAKTGDGITELLDEIARLAEQQFEGAAGAIVATERHRLAFSEAAMALSRLQNAQVEGVELVAEELRVAARAMERIAGRIEVEEVLGAIFARLCVGK